MFDALKKKLTGWFKKKPEEEKTAEKPKKKKIFVKREETEIEKKIKEIRKKTKEAEREEKKEIKEAKKLVEEESSEEQDEELLEKEIKESAEEVKGEKIDEEDKVIGELAEKEEEGEKEGFFARLVRTISTSKLKEEDFDDFFDEFEMTLAENNVALEVVDKIRESLRGSLVGKQFGKKEVKSKINEALKKSIELVLIEGKGLVNKIKKKEGTYVILFFGINGSGKTTSIAKLAYLLKKEGISVVMAAADTFRAASIEQLKEHGKKLGVEVIASKYGADPAAVAFDAIQHAEKHKKKVVLIDTAGRMHTKKDLMREMEKIVRVAKPDMKIFVGESITGNDATEQARTFNDTVGIDGIILSKADVDEKAGAILSVGYVTGKAILFLGIGQRYEDLREFKKEDVLEGLGLD